MSHKVAASSDGTHGEGLNAGIVLTTMRFFSNVGQDRSCSA